MPTFNIRGGSAAEPVRSFKSPFFQKDVKVTQLSRKKEYKLRLLPAFDDRLSVQDPGYRLSYVPYRDATAGEDVLDSGERSPAFTTWFYIFRGHDFLGSGNFGYVSQLTGQDNPTAGLDPLFDCYRVAKQAGLKQLIEKPKDQKNGKAIIPMARYFFVANAFMRIDDHTWENHAICGSKSTLDDLRTILATKAGRNDPVVSPEWQDFLYGDVTHPLQGLVAWVEGGRPAGLEKMNVETSCFRFCGKNQGRSLVGAEQFPIDPNTPYGQQVLASRYVLPSIFEVAEYQTIVDYLVQDGSIPYDVVKAACDQHCNVPPQPASARKASYSMAPRDTVEEDNVPMSGPTPMAAMPGQPGPQAFGAPSSAPAGGARPAFGAPVGSPAGAPVSAPLGGQPFRPAAGPAVGPSTFAAAPVGHPAAAPVGHPAAAPAFQPAAAPVTPAPTAAFHPPTTQAPYAGQPAAAPQQFQPQQFQQPAQPAAQPMAPVGAPPPVAGYNPQEKARYDELVKKLGEQGGNALNPSEYQELMSLGVKYGSQP